MENKKLSFYEELQLGSAELKKIIARQPRFKDKALHSLIYVLKVALNVGFAFLFVTVYSMIFGSENSAVGVAVLLAILSFQHVDLDVGNKSAMLAFPVLFLILAVGPRLANSAGPMAGIGVNLVCLMAILTLGCHRVEYMNHFTFVLGYLLLYGYDVSWESYGARLLAIAAGAALTMLVYIHRHRSFVCDRRLRDLFFDFNLHTERTQWQTASALLISAALLVFGLLHVPRPMWIGFAVMSICYPFRANIRRRAFGRVAGTCTGLMLFAFLNTLLPEDMFPYFGLIGGIGVGFSERYWLQTMFNALGALSVAVPLLGIEDSLGLRAVYNMAGAAFVVFAVYLFGLVKDKARTKLHKDFANS